MRGRIPRLGLLLVLLAPLACTEETNPLGFDSGSRGDPLVVAETLLIAQPEADAASRPSRSTGSSLSILVGSDEEATARGYVRFGSLPDTVGLRFAYLQLHAKRGRGERVELVARRVIGTSDAWEPSELSWDNQPQFDETPLDTPRPIPTGTLASGEVDTIPRIGIPFSLIKFWKEYPDSNAGLVLMEASEPEGSGVARIVSNNDVVFTSSGAVDPTPTLIFSSSTGDEFEAMSTSDAYVTLDKRPLPAGTDSVATVSSGLPSRYHLRFDLSEVPDAVSVVRATLNLPLAPGFPADTLRLAAYQTTEEWEEESLPDSLETATSPGFIQTYDDMEVAAYQMELGGLAQEWLKGEENFGVTIRFADETAALQSVELLTREAARGPSLELIFLRPIDFRWDGHK